MVKIIDAIEMCEVKSNLLRSEVDKISKVVEPKFIIINASDDEGNARYINNKVKEGRKIGLIPQVVKLDKDCTCTDILKIIAYCNDNRIPVILQLPVYQHLNVELLMNTIEWYVDADGFSREWIGQINLGFDKSVVPATSKGVMSLLEYHDVHIHGKNVLIIGSSNHVGKPMIPLILNRGGTVINANSSTNDLSSLVKISDIIISCVGKPNLICPHDVKDNAVLIGVGFTYINGKQILDFDIDDIVADGRAALVTNRINCTGKATVISLLENVVELYKYNYNIK